MWKGGVYNSYCSQGNFIDLPIITARQWIAEMSIPTICQQFERQCWLHASLHGRAWLVMGLSQLLHERMRPNVVRAKKFAICFINVGMEKCSYESTHDLKRHFVSDVQWYVIDLAMCLTPWCVRCATKASVVRRSDSIVWVVRWSDDGTFVNAIRRTVNVRSCESSCESSCSCSLIFSICITRWGGIGTAAPRGSWKSNMVWITACL